MPERIAFNGLDKFALWFIGEKSINKSAPSGGPLGAVMQYWTSQSNITVVFATIFSSISIVLFIELDIWIAMPFFIGFLYFVIRTWAFGRCAQIACRLWK